MKYFKSTNVNTIVNRYATLLLAIIMVFSVFNGIIKNTVDAEGTEVSATDSHIVYSDTFDGNELDSAKWVWAGASEKPQYSATVSDGKLHLANADAGGSSVAGLRYVKNAKHLEQRAEVEFVCEFGLKPLVWVRADQKWSNAYSSVSGYMVVFNCNQNGSTDVTIQKRNENYATTELAKSRFTAEKGAKYRMELVAQGSSPTLVATYVYKVTASGEAVVAVASAVDNEACLQDAGTAGVSYIRTSAVTATTVSIDKFEYTTTDNVTGKYYIEEGTTGSKTFGQLVVLDPTKKYIFAAYAKDNGLRNGEDVNALWIEYFNNSSSSTRVLTSRANLKSTRDPEVAEDAGIDYNEYFTVFYDEFNLAACSDKKTESGNNNKTRVIVGFRYDGSTATAGMFTHFMLYAADDPNKTNLLVNPDFKMGLYAWNDSAASYMNYTQHKESDGVAANGFAKLKSISDDDYDTLFKNKSYTGPIVPVKDYMVKNTGVDNNGKFGQVIELDSNKEYVYSVNYKYVTQNGSKPSIWYKNNDGEYELFEDYTFIMEEMTETKIIHHFRPDASNIKKNGEKVEVLVGYSSGSAGAEAYYANFALYLKEDTTKTNLFKNYNFKSGLKGWTASCYDGFAAIEDETVMATENGCAELVELKSEDYFVRSSVTDGKIVIHNNGDKGYGKVGNIVYLKPGKTYVYGVSYKYINQNSCKPFLQYNNANGAMTHYDPDTYSLNITNDDKYFRNYYEFNVPTDGKIESDGTVKMKIGYTTGGEGADAYFGDFVLYEKGDASKTNLLINADFALGFKGWSDEGTPISATNVYSIFGADLVVVSEDFFKIPTMEKLEGNWVAHNTGKLAYAKFTQIVDLDPAKTYVYAVSYRYIDQKGCKPFILYYNGSDYINYTEIISETQDSEFYRVYYEFKVPKEAAIQVSGKAKMKVGITCGMEGADAYFGDFLLYEKGDSAKTNLLVNADFGYGLYGWTSNGYNNLPISDYGVMQTKNGDVELVKMPDDYFKRPKFEKLEGNWVVHNTGKVEYAKFGQIVELDPSKTYVYEASYKYIKQNGSMPFMLYYDGKGYVNYTEFISEIQDDTYYKAIYEFKIPKEAAVGANGKAKMKIGITAGALGADSYFGDFLLYEKGDSSKTNIFINSDFSLGLYGWTSTGYNDQPITEYGTMTTLKGCVELVKVEENYFKRPAFEKFTEEPMFHITGKWNYAHPGQMVELTPGETYYYSMHEKYFAQNGSKPLVFVKVNGSYEAIAKQLEVKSQDPMKCFTVYEFTVPKNVDLKSNGNSDVLVGFTTGIIGADAYFYDLQLYSAKDESKTNLFVNPDFEYGLFGWMSTSYNYKPETEYGITIFRYKQDAELLPYDPTIFVNDLSDEFFDDGDWASKFGADYTMEEWLNKLGVSTENKAPVDNETDIKVEQPQSNNTPWIITAVVGGLVLIAGAVVVLIIVIKKKKKA